ncbi:HAD-IA family hydrolase [Peteryoungia desertarenae]|uniref:HAD-IA family hydrolase n=1 Tax=Peteryoungia desertarenae TaxID=1813451 RepID=A0ABX6QPY6_9HYPH|nr:HAD-IA family hydrolase [Peteryoungia desertarenae]QLF70623.1 HAD-IA family hydrolase [Peteryoungia desertarenae]
MKLVLFDCDGTLVDSGGLIHEVMLRTFAAFGKPAPELVATKSIIGLTLDIAIARIDGKPHADEEAVAMADYYKSIYSDVRGEGAHAERMFPGIRAMLDALIARDDLLLGAVTGKSRRGLDLVLDGYDLRPHLLFNRTADDCPSKPHPAMVTECCDEAGIAPRETIVIGDAVYDIQMAKAAGAAAIGVSWGYSTVDALWAAGADAVVEDPAHIPSYIHQG